MKTAVTEGEPLENLRLKKSHFLSQTARPNSVPSTSLATPTPSKVRLFNLKRCKSDHKTSGADVIYVYINAQAAADEGSCGSKHLLSPVMFSVKVTYNGEIRRFSFPDSATFPSYEQLYSQLIRVFPSRHNYYLNKLLFFPDASKPSRILIGSQVRNAEDYRRCIVAFRGRTWPNASLRFILIEGKADMGQEVAINQTVGQLPWAGSFNGVPNSADTAQSTSNPRPFITSYSPLAFAVPPRAVSHIPLDDDVAMDVPNYSSASFRTSSFESTSSNRASDTATSGSSIAQVKKDVENLLKAFQRDLDQTMGRLSESTTPNVDQPSINTTPAQLGSTSSSSPLSCSYCTKSVLGQWLTCNNCSDVVCSQCSLGNVAIVCPVSGAGHTFRPAARSSNFSASLGAQSQAPTEPSPNLPFIPPLPKFLNVDVSESSDPVSPLFTPILTPRIPPPPPAIHQGIICDSCHLIIEGVRHKCLDCPDYDLCTPCVAIGAHERHNSRHQFLDIAEPGRIPVHTANQPEDREDRAPHSRSTSTPGQPFSHRVVHHATCDLCDSLIEGHRYKCAVCPDFDTCESCFIITEEQHPRHSFVRISKTEDYIPRGSSFIRRHFARCDACDTTIIGIRYKCMHPDCPDFDLCERCEALPIPQHPDTHPFLKMRSVETIIPTVYRSPVALRSSLDDTSMPSWSFNQTSLAERRVRPLADSTSSDAGLPRPLPDNSAVQFVSSLLTSPSRISPAPEPDTISHSLYPLLDQPPPKDSWLQSMSNAFSDKEVAPLGCSVASSSHLSELADKGLDYRKSSLSLPSSQLPALLDVNDTPAVPGSWYGSGLNSIINKIADELDTSHSIHENWTQTPQKSTPTAPNNETLPNRRPTPRTEMCEVNSLKNRSFVELLKGPHSVSSLSLEDQGGLNETNFGAKEPLSASSVEDVTVPDGQTFVAGATFIKVWRMINNGTRDWPASTEVVFVGGAQLADGRRPPHIQPMCNVGPLIPGQEKNVWTPELKAPDVPGRYTSYWRLRDDMGHVFGDSIWVDIEVIEPSEESLTSSSMIIMPDPTSPQSPATDERTTSRSPTIDSDDYLSDSSSVSIVSMPSSEDEADATLWEESRVEGNTSPGIQSTGVHAAVQDVPEHTSMAMDYVLLYDDNTSEEE